MSGAIAPPTEVLGVPLYPGERVVRYEAYGYAFESVALGILGVLTMCMLIGFFFLHKALTMSSRNPSGFAVTTHRIIVGTGGRFNAGRPILLPLAEVAELVPIRAKGSLLDIVDDGLVGAVVSAGVTALENQVVDKFDRTTKVYWRNAEDVLAILRDGSRTKLHSRSPSEDGQFLSEGMARGSFDDYPDVLVE